MCLMIYIHLIDTVEFYSEIAISLNFTAEHIEDSGLDV
jgi:hypothetical protein